MNKLSQVCTVVKMYKPRHTGSLRIWGFGARARCTA